jgi:hypothetical protein
VAFALDAACGSCHFDPHRGRFSAAGDRPARGGCTACHGLDAFRPAHVDPARHAEFAYPLEGAHRTVPCGGCHAALLEPPPHVALLAVHGQPRALAFTEPHESCEACHSTPHGEQFVARTGGCASCHDLHAFRPASRFDHRTSTRFPLDGEHREVPCERCHARQRAGDGERVLYRPLAHGCRDCHTGREPGSLGGAS